VIDREEVERRMRAFIGPTPAFGDITASDMNWIVDRAVDVASNLLREFGHVAGCGCALNEKLLSGKATDPRCFQQSPAKETTSSTAWHCAKCKKPMQFFDGICFSCSGGKDPGD
jgi:hypothetical protein